MQYLKNIVENLGGVSFHKIKHNNNIATIKLTEIQSYDILPHSYSWKWIFKQINYNELFYHQKRNIESIDNIIMEYLEQYCEDYCFYHIHKQVYQNEVPKLEEDEQLIVQQQHYIDGLGVIDIPFNNPLYDFDECMFMYMVGWGYDFYIVTNNL